MGVCLSVMLNKEVADADLRDTDGKTLFDCALALDKIGESRGITPLFSSFIFDPESMDEPPDGELIEETYYNPKDGLRVVTGLIAALEPDSVERLGGWHHLLDAGFRVGGIDEVLRMMKESDA